MSVSRTPPRSAASRVLFLLFALTALTPGRPEASGPATPAVNPDPSASTSLVYFGTRDKAPGASIRAAKFHPSTGSLEDLGTVSDVVYPHWLTAHPTEPILYATTNSEASGGGAVVALRADMTDGSLLEIGQASSEGQDPTHVAVDPLRSNLFVANFRTGTVAALPLSSEGAPEPATSVSTHEGSGPHRRQASPRAHGVFLDSTGRYLLAPNLGADRIYVYDIASETPDLVPASPAFTAAPPGSGPRHLAFGRSGRFAYTLFELTAEIQQHAWDSDTGTLTALTRFPTMPPSFEGKRSLSELLLSTDGRFLYLSSRSDDSLVVYAIDEATGALTEVQRVPSGGTTPWHIALDPSETWLLVANNGSDEVVVFRRDPETGRLSPTSHRLGVPKASNVTFLAPSQGGP